jgi:cation transport regulator ChaB
MPMTTKKGKPKKSELPGTVARSGKKARRTFAKAHDSALEEYGNEKQARKVAYSALEQTHRKSGDRWKKKKGSSDEVQVSMEWSKAALYDVAKELDIEGRSTMSKKDLVQAIGDASRR